MAVVVVRDGQIVEQAAARRRSLSSAVAVTVDHRWHVGSLSKAMPGTLAGVVMDRSVISWETGPLDVWPELADTMHAGFRSITLRHLLTHTSAMARDSDILDFPGQRSGHGDGQTSILGRASPCRAAGGSAHLGKHEAG